MAEKRRGLGRGIGALIPTIDDAERPSDIFFSPRTPGHVGQAGDGNTATDRSSHPGQQLSPSRESVAGHGSTTGASERRIYSRESGEVGASAETPVTSGSGEAVGTGEAVGSGEAVGIAETLVTGGTVEAGGTRQANSPSSAGSPSQTPGAADDGLRPVPGVRMAELPVNEITPNPRQPREVFDEEYLEELAASISEVGLLQPIVVRPSPDGASATWELVMGERRLRAAAIAGLETIPAVIKETDDSEMLRDALLENLHRADLNPLEEASAYQQLLDDFGCTQEELARRVARSRPQISNTLRLLKLPPLVQRRVAAGVLSAGHARTLLGLDDGAAMERLAQRIVAEGLSVRATEEIVALGEAPAEPQMRRRRAVSQHQGELDGLATRLADRFDTRVKVTMGARRGRITVDFASFDDLKRILATLAPGEALPDAAFSGGSLPGAAELAERSELRVPN
ncbi:MAG TPA: ParB/RepB/Spo0J family partition protein [Actinomycetaceae bacterium]|nr:ParB/RepB/Spo0J family partition protein [Actinomycetaceae bacterium]